MRAEEIMTSPAVTIRQGESLEKAADLLLEHEIGSLPVVDKEGALVGILTEEDFTADQESVPWGFFEAPKLFDEWLDTARVDQAYERARSMKVRRVMTSPVRTVEPGSGIDEVVALMLKHRISHVPVAEDGNVVGMISKRDLLRMLRSERS